MKIGVVKEIKKNENRVSLTPAGARELKKHGHQVFIEKNAGIGSGYKDDQYIEAGAVIYSIGAEIYAEVELLLKVKEPIESEYKIIKPSQIVFTYFHFASSKALTDAMISSKSICIAYETLENNDRSLPLLIPMSEVAGRMSIQQGAIFLEKHNKGKGILLGGVPGVKPAHVVILGAGVVGTQAAKMAAGLGAQVTLFDVNLTRLRYLDDILPANVTTVMSNDHIIRETVKTADLIIGAVLIPGGKAPVLVTKEMLKTMQPGTVLIDVAVDQGGCIETCRPTTHDDPTFIIDDIVHYCVANMPGAVPYTSTLALTNVTLPYILEIANKGWKDACRNNVSLAKGLNIIQGKIVNKEVAKAFNYLYTPIENL